MIGGLVVAGLDSLLVELPPEFTILAVGSALVIAVGTLSYNRFCRKSDNLT